jgi:hypothetical protein
MIKNNWWMAFCITITIVFVHDLVAQTIETKIPYYCYVTSGCGSTPPGDMSSNCFKEKFCIHRFVIANDSTVRWFYSFVEGDIGVITAPIFSYDILPPSSFIEYTWQKSSGIVNKYISEWDKDFFAKRQGGLMPDDPADLTINDTYIVLAVTERALKDALQNLVSSKNWTTVKDVIVLKLTATMGAKNKNVAVSSLVIVGSQPNIRAISFTSGLEAKKIDEANMSKVVSQNRQYKPSA